MKTLVFTMFSASTVVFSGALLAGPLTVPNTFAPGDTVSSSQMNQNFTAVKTAVDDNDSRISTNKDNISTLQTSVANLQTSINCQGQDASDVMVQVGPLCVDKYEASVWDGSGNQLGVGIDDYDNVGCTDNGNGCTAAGTTKPIYARSQAGVEPSRYITWFQAQQACANVGKRLLTNAEWQMAAAGTPGGDDGTCNGSGTIVNTDANAGCVSTYGAANMAGNVWEWVADWIQGAGVSVSNNNNTPLYGSDSMINIGAASGQGGGANFPAAILRGGGVGDTTNIGIFAFAAYHAPSNATNEFGFRCAR